MAVSRPNDPVEVRFRLPEGEFATRATRGQIVHEAFPKALPPELVTGHRLTFAINGDEVFADNFLGDLADAYGDVILHVTAAPIPAKAGEWRNIGFDHLAITVADRAGARDFFHDVLKMQVMRDDPHLTVLATGHTALFLFDAGLEDAPLTTSQPSRWHHIGFVVDDLEAAYADLYAHRDRLQSDFTLLERDERWSLYFFYRNGDVTFMIQLSQVKVEERGFDDGHPPAFARFLYDYTSRPYGLVFSSDDDRKKGAGDA